MQHVVDDVRRDAGETLEGTLKEFGCEVKDTLGVVRLLVTTLPDNSHLLGNDLHCAHSTLQLRFITFLPYCSQCNVDEAAQSRHTTRTLV